MFAQEMDYYVPNKIAKILKIFDRVKGLKSQGVKFWC